MKILTLPTPMHCCFAGIEVALRLMSEAGEGPKNAVTVMVGPDDLNEARRLIHYMAEKDAIGRGAAAHANYLWQGDAKNRWAVIGRDVMVYVLGPA